MAARSRHMNYPTPNELPELLRYLTPHERAELDRLLKARKKWVPLPGPQTEAYHCDADILLYGGAAGGGKTDLALGKAIQKHQRSLILRREYPQLAGIIERSDELYASYGAYNEGKGRWRCAYDGKRRTIEFGSVQYEKDKSKFQGRPHDLIVFDEAANFLRSIVEFIIGWLRTEDPDQRTQVLLCSNPPTDATGDWLIEWFAPWLDPHHPRPALPGELRWFIVAGSDHIEVDGPAPVVHNGEQYTPLSRTFIPAKVTDNPYYAESGYVAKLQALPEPLRSKMLYGDFAAGREDDAYQIIPSEWVRAAQERWKACPRPAMPMSALGTDVARGGKDQTIHSPRYGTWFAEQVCYPGADTPDGHVVARQIFALIDATTRINIDAVGVGASPYDIVHAAIGDRIWGISSAQRTEELDVSGVFGFANVRALLWWRMREALDPVNGFDLALPPDRELFADLCAPRYKKTARGILVETKDEIRSRIGRSPDKGDSAVYALAEPQAAFAFGSI